MNRPNFLIIGERRSGSTSLAKWISNHPEIYIHPQMDKAYFVDSELVGIQTDKEGQTKTCVWRDKHTVDEYYSFFDKRESETAIGEKSADYLFWEPCHQRIKDFIPEVRILITLRNPIDRAWSMYWNEFGKGRETLSFEDAINREEERAKDSDYGKLHFSYITRGFYQESIERLLQTFNRNQIYIVILEEANNDLKSVLKEVYSFLKVDPNKGLDGNGSKVNTNWTLVAKPYIVQNKVLCYLENQIFSVFTKFVYRIPKLHTYSKRKFIKLMFTGTRKHKSEIVMNLSTRKKLQKLYKPHIESLESLLQKDLSVWLKE